ncbi:NADH-quinone oxidoreductase subunit L [Streptomyces oceani]|uniref:NADH dehydrogenase n=1 Tax=Streptomyces oceani TaxID=1075402 RepID=A0A1E7KJR6_9ACTN|nr:proton-conducting transporter membrane subunit [Streptomyces oceani]OEV04242.1 NADH dehydrogenase [Streptomyces oceani]
MLIPLLLGLPLFSGTMLLLGRPARGAVVAGTLAAAGTLGVAVAAAVERPVDRVPLLAGIPAGFAVDGLSGVLVILVPAVLLASLLVSAAEPDLRTGRFHALMLIFAGAMLATVTSTTLPPLLMAWEVMGATSWALISYQLDDPRAARAGTVAFLTTRTADLGLYVAGGAVLAGSAGTMALADVATLDGGWLHVAIGGIVLATLGKSAQLPFSFWLSGAMRGPSPVSALLHSATMVAAGGYLLLRLAPALDAAGWAAPLVAWVGVATALLMGLVAVVQDDLKQLLAASTCAQIGFIVLAAGTAGTQAGLLHMVAHAAAKSVLFLVAGLWLAALGSRSLSGGLRGAARRHPIVGTAFTAAALSLAGLAPLSLWVSKDAVLAAAATTSSGLYVAGLVAALVAALYSGRALWHVWQPAPTTGTAGPTRLARSATAVNVVLAVAAMGAGLLALGPEPLRPQPPPHAGELVVSAALALAGVLLAWRYADRMPDPAALEGWLRLEPAARRWVARPVLRLAALLARFDERGLARVPERTGRAALALARRTDGVGERALDRAVGGVTGGAQALGRAARRPQTGRLHQYYAQASVVFALLGALAVLLIAVR